MKVKISIIVPVHNTELYLNRCIDSILAQTCSDFELILVDNGSVDRSGSICDSYAETDNRIVAIHIKESGSAKGRNIGLDYVFQHNNSEWVTFIDSDDWISPLYLEKLLDDAEKNGIAVCGYKQTAEYENETLSLPLKNVAVKTEDFYCDKLINVIVPWGKLLKKDCLRVIRFPEGKAHEDEFFTYKLLFEFEQIIFIDEPLYYYFVNPEGLTYSKWTPKELDKLDAVKEQIRFFKERSLKRAYTRAIAYYYSTAYSFLKQAEKEGYEKETQKLRMLINKHMLCYGFRLLQYRFQKK